MAAYLQQQETLLTLSIRQFQFKIQGQIHQNNKPRVVNIIVDPSIRQEVQNLRPVSTPITLYFVSES